MKNTKCLRSERFDENRKWVLGNFPTFYRNYRTKIGIDDWGIVRDELSLLVDPSVAYNLAVLFGEVPGDTLNTVFILDACTTAAMIEKLPYIVECGMRRNPTVRRHLLQIALLTHWSLIPEDELYALLCEITYDDPHLDDAVMRLSHDKREKLIYDVSSRPLLFRAVYEACNRYTTRGIVINIKRLILAKGVAHGSIDYAFKINTSVTSSSDTQSTFTLDELLLLAMHNLSIYRHVHETYCGAELRAPRDLRIAAKTSPRVFTYLMFLYEEHLAPFGSIERGQLSELACVEVRSILMEA